MTPAEYTRLVVSELRDITRFLRSLAPEQWAAPSLCTAWTVRDVAGHLCSGYARLGPSLLWHSFRAGGGLDGFVAQVAIGYAATHTTDALIATLEEAASRGEVRRLHTGLKARLLTPEHLLADHLVHHQDMRRPLGLPREIPRDRLLATLLSVEAHPPRRGLTTGLRLEASDLDRGFGVGELVRGPAEALILVLHGRSAALENLSGPGVEVLRARLLP